MYKKKNGTEKNTQKMEEWSHIPRIEQPKDPRVRVKLFPHQLASVWKMLSIEKTTVFDASVEFDTVVKMCCTICGVGV